MDAAVVFTPNPASNKVIKLGTFAGFSSPPTIAEINASSDWNQVIALLNRRMSQIYNTSTPLDYFGNVAGVIPIRAIDVNAIMTAIDTLYDAVGLAHFGFTSVNSNQVIAGHTLADLQDSLSPAFFQTAQFKLLSSASFQSTRNDNPFGTQISTSSASASGTTLTGTAYAGGVGPAATRNRMGLNFLIPCDYNSALTLSVVSSNTAFKRGDIYASNTDDHTGSGTWWQNLDNLLASNILTSSTTTFPLSSNAQFLSKSGQYVSLVLGLHNEMINNSTADALNYSTTARLSLAGFGF